MSLEEEKLDRVDLDGKREVRRRRAGRDESERAVDSAQLRLVAPLTYRVSGPPRSSATCHICDNTRRHDPN